MRTWPQEQAYGDKQCLWDRLSRRKETWRGNWSAQLTTNWGYWDYWTDLGLPLDHRPSKHNVHLRQRKRCETSKGQPLSRFRRWGIPDSIDEGWSAWSHSGLQAVLLTHCNLLIVRGVCNRLPLDDWRDSRECLNDQISCCSFNCMLVYDMVLRSQIWTFRIAVASTVFTNAAK